MAEKFLAKLFSGLKMIDSAIQDRIKKPLESKERARNHVNS
jgi:hypothetical protein